MEKQKFKGLPYPVEKHARGYFRTQWGVNQIKSDLLILLLTNPGERVMMPEFGTPLKRLFFEPNDQEMVEEARDMIIDSIARWEPRIAISDVEVSTGGDDIEGEENLDTEEHVLHIKIVFIDPEDIESVQELVLQMPYGG